MAVDPLLSTPYFFIGPRPYREAELAAYVRREHRRGRDVADILKDPCLARRGGETMLRAVLSRPGLIRALKEDVVEAIRQHESELRRREADGDEAVV
jgi:hypothetical protein